MSQSLSFLPLTFDTIRHMQNLTLAAGKSHLVQPLHITMSQSLVSEETTTFGAFDGQTPVGLIAVEDTRVMDGTKDTPIEDCLLIWQLAVAGSHERQGFGTAMVDFAKDYARIVGLSGVALATLDRADHSPLPFYERQGFAPTGRRLQDGPDDLLELRWRR